jgi:nitrate/nitrite-specific signal transduction histidine kinase
MSYKKVLIGTLRLTCQAGKTLAQEQIEFMDMIAPGIALALVVAIANPRQLAHVRLQTRVMEQQQTAIDLHNALAQQISFLHLGLDRLASDDQLRMSDSVRDELEYMRLAAAEAYQQVRNTLVVLLSWDSVDLTQAIVDYSFKVAQRAHMSNGFTTTGEPVSLPSTLRRQIFSLVQEGLNNIEKYAQAQHIHVSLIWSVDCLMISIVDDGIGFDPSSVQTEGHYGLMMMRELVKAMQGHFAIDSSPGHGTELNFNFPLPNIQTDPVGDRNSPIQSYTQTG